MGYLERFLPVVHTAQKLDREPLLPAAHTALPAGREPLLLPAHMAMDLAMVERVGSEPRRRRRNQWRQGRG